MDAISFVVGLQSKDLRGKQLKDLIYKNGQDDGTEERAASVSLVCTKKGKETKFTRAITARGAGEYRVNGSVTDRKGYESALESFGVMAKAHTGFLVPQGYVAELAAKSAGELGALFEQISGSGELKEEYDDLERQKRAAEEEQIYNHQKRKGLAHERNVMKKQKEEAEHFTRLEDRRRELQKQVYLHKLLGVEREICALRQQQEEEETQAAKASEKCSEAEEKVKASEKERSRLARTCVELERKLVTVQKELEQHSPASIKLSEEMKHLERRRLTNVKSLERQQAMFEKSQKEQARLEDELRQITEEIARKEKEQAQAEATGELALGKKQQEEYNRLKAEAGKSTAELQDKMQAKTREMGNKEHAIQQYRTRVDELTAERESLAAKINALKERKQASAERIKELTTGVAQLKAEMEQTESSNAHARSRQGELRATVAELQAKISASKVEQKDSEREKRSKEALENLSRLFPGVHGRMTDVCKPTQRKYDAAVTIAMGKNMDAIVVDAEATAIECIKYLKEKKCAPELFVPIDTIRFKPAAERLRALGGTTKLVIDVITVEERFERAVQYAVGDTLVCDSLDEARSLAYHSGDARYKVVTLDGTLISKAGLMTGGGSVADRARSSKWNAKEYEKLRSALDAAERALAEIASVHSAEATEQDLRHRFERATFELDNAKTDLQMTTTKETKHRENMRALEKELASSEKKLKDSQERKAADASALAALEAQRNGVEDRIFAAFSASLGLSSVREYEERNLKSDRESEQQMLEMTSVQSQLRAQLEYEQRKNLPGAIAKMQASLAKEEATLAQKKKKQQELDATIAGLKQTAAGVEQQVQSAKADQDSFAAECKALKKNLKTASDELAKLRSSGAQTEAELTRLRSQRQGTFQRARLEEVDVPLLRAGDEAPKGTSAKRKRGSGASAAPAADILVSEAFNPSGAVGGSGLDGDGDGGEPSAAEAAEAHEAVRIDFSTIDIRGDADEPIEKELASTLAEIEGMAPNMKALEQFDEVQARLHSMEGEHRETATAAKSVTQRFLAVQSKRHKLFMAAFDHVSRVIDAVYKDLTQVEGVPLGGTAYLSLEDPSEPFLHGIKYTAMPPAKRFRDMDQLSGGERTVAALALLFAIHDFHPSPFFVMDEVDAALDNVNVTRVAEYIRERSEDGQLQFVVISLKDTFYAKAQGLVGIFRDRRVESSRTVTLDLDRLDMNDGVDASDDE